MERKHYFLQIRNKRDAHSLFWNNAAVFSWFSVVIMLFVLVGNRWMLSLFGKVEVCNGCCVIIFDLCYFIGLAIYNAVQCVSKLGQENVHW